MFIFIKVLLFYYFELTSQNNSSIFVSKSKTVDVLV